MKLFTLSVLLLMTNFAFANFNNQMDIETKLEKRIQQILSSIDSHVQVYVKVDMKQINSPLPGISSERSLLSTNALTDRIDFNDIRKINVNIIGSLEKLPDWTLEELKKTINTAQTPLQFSYQQYDSSFLQEIEKQNPFNKAASQIQNSILKEFSSTAHIFILIFMSGIVVFAVTLFLIALKIKKTFVHQTQFLAEQLSQNQLEPHSIIDLTQEESSRIPNDYGTILGHTNKLQNMNYESILSLMSDCYWTKNDSYAHFIWQNISYENQIQLLNSVDYFQEYSEYFITLASTDLQEATHPYYFRKNLNLTYTSQEDIAQQMKTQPSLWHILSPLRQKNLQLNIEQKMKCIQSKMTVQIEFKTSSSQSTKFRTLPKTQSLSELSIEDEISILDNPKLISNEMRSQIQTLIWFAQLDLEKRKTILANLSAEDIARAYIGPESVLNSIQEAVSEKKLKLIQSISHKIQPNRKSESFKYIFEKSISEAA